MAERGTIKKILNAERVQDHGDFYRVILRGTYIDIIEANKKLKKEGFMIHGVTEIADMLCVDVVKK